MGDKKTTETCGQRAFDTTECSCITESDASVFTGYRNALLSDDYIGKKLRTNVDVYYYDTSGIERSVTGTLTEAYECNGEIGNHNPSHLGTKYTDFIFRNGYGGDDEDYNNKKFGVIYIIQLPQGNPLPNYGE